MPNIKKNILTEVKSLLIVISIAFLIRVFFIELFFVPTCSMQATILNNDYILSTKYNYGFSKYSLPFCSNLFKDRIFSSFPKRGDIIVMYLPYDRKIRYVKRLIGLPGEKIEVKEDTTYINDVPVDRKEAGTFVDEEGNKYKKYKETFSKDFSFYTYKLTKSRDNFGPYTIPSGCFFFMGDNRDESGDSRYQLGFVPFENLIAKAQVVLFSTKEIFWIKDIKFLDQLSRFQTWISSIRGNRILKSLYEQKHSY